DVVITTFGDMMRVPGSSGSLLDEKANGADVRVVYSTLDALALAEQESNKQVVFMGIGFETTIPTIARAIRLADDNHVVNFLVYMAGKTMPEPMDVLAGDPEIGLHGFLCPAHVSTIIGTRAYEPIVEKYHIPCVAAGFEPLDILQGVLMLMEQVASGTARVENEYSRVATVEGNRTAQELMAAVLEPCAAQWRGIGVIPNSGLKIRTAYAAHDAQVRFHDELAGSLKPDSSKAVSLHACQCGEVLKGKIVPPQCPLFGKACTPQNPVGPCMVSSEGSCSAYYRYERE
ncbi:MAG TPA: hydrogenase formation protein HypD, partial [bacterium]|nr:hydrogenase formation protein HypD [bacterium]